MGNPIQKVYVVMSNKCISSLEIGQSLPARDGRSKKHWVRILVQRVGVIHWCLAAMARGSNDSFTEATTQPGSSCLLLNGQR